MRIRLWSAILFALVLSLAPARAERPAPTPVATPEATARAAYQRGLKHFAVSDYTAALAAFKEAWLVSEKPAFLFNIAQCHRQLGNREEAIQHFRNYLDLVPRAADRAEIEVIIVRLRREIEQQRAAANRAPTPAAPVVVAPVVPAAAVEAPVKDPASAPVPLYKRPLLWVGVGGAAALVAAGVTVGLVLWSADARIPDANRISVSFP